MTAIRSLISCCHHERCPNLTRLSWAICRQFFRRQRFALRLALGEMAGALLLFSQQQWELERRFRVFESES
jgi:hypothetical protein